MAEGTAVAGETPLADGREDRQGVKKSILGWVKLPYGVGKWRMRASVPICILAIQNMAGFKQEGMTCGRFIAASNLAGPAL